MASFRQILRRLKGFGGGLGLLSPEEARTGMFLVGTAVIHGILQTLTLIGVVGMVQWMVEPQKTLPLWLSDAIRALFGETDKLHLSLVLGSMLLVLVLVKTLFTWVQTGWLSRFSAGCENRLSSLLMRRVLLAPYCWLVMQNSGRLQQLLFGFVAVWSRDFIRTLMKFTNDLIVALFILLALIVSEPVAGLAVAGAGALIALTSFLIVRPRLNRLARTKRAAILHAGSISAQCILGVKDVKMAGAEAGFVQAFDREVDIYSGSDSEAQQWSILPRLALEFIVYAGLLLAGMYAALAQTGNRDFSGVILLYGLAALRLMPLVSTVVGSLSTMINTFPVIDDILRLLDETRESEADAPRLFGDWQQIRLEDVSVRYAGSAHPSLDGVNVTLRRGGVYGCVGPSGAGKSTFIDVLTGLLAPETGAVTIDGTPLRPDQRRGWRRNIAYVSQRPFILDASLKENIVFSQEPADKARLDEVIRLARLEQVVARLAQGVDSPLGEQGALLSGGERQRVAIARALYRDASLIILDEATSALDVLVERDIAETLALLRGRVTLLIVSHRLGLVQDADCVFVFEDGQMRASGPHDVLMADSLYRQMVEQSQHRAAG